jgi:hypothetical protein
MREHGVKNFPNPEVTGDVVKLVVKGNAGEVSPQTMEAAQKACQRYSPAEQQNLTPQQKVEREEQALKFIRCMREHGVNLPNPQTKGGGIQFNRRNGPNPESPAFQAAQKSCQGLLPGLKGKGPAQLGGPVTKSAAPAGSDAGKGGGGLSYQEAPAGG